MGCHGHNKKRGTCLSSGFKFLNLAVVNGFVVEKVMGWPMGYKPPEPTFQESVYVVAEIDDFFMPLCFCLIIQKNDALCNGSKENRNRAPLLRFSVFLKKTFCCLALFFIFNLI